MKKLTTFIILLFVVLLIGCCAKYSRADMTDEGVEIIDIRPVTTPTPTPPPPPLPTPTPKVIEYKQDADTVYALARWFYNSCYQEGDLDGKRQGAWHLWNRVIDDSDTFPDTILEVITQNGEYDFLRQTRRCNARKPCYCDRNAQPLHDGKEWAARRQNIARGICISDGQRSTYRLLLQQN